MKGSFIPIETAAVSEQKGDSFPRLVQVMQRLLAPDGCPWDREQDFASLRRYVLEEACEVIDAIDADDRKELREELGDLLLQVVFLGELARREGSFGPDDIVAAIVDKLVSRHPHVFGDLQLEDSDQVLDNWERLKAVERKERGNDKGVLGGVPSSLPALVRAQRVGDKVRRVGFDWEAVDGPRSKLNEELTELDLAMAEGDKTRVSAELGDTLFALVNLARHLEIDAEAALRGTIRKFESRFSHVEQRVNEKHGGFAQGKLPLQQLEAYWREAKEQEL